MIPSTTFAFPSCGVGTYAFTMDRDEADRGGEKNCEDSDKDRNEEGRGDLSPGLIGNPHDAFFKSVFSEPEHAVGFLALRQICITGSFIKCSLAPENPGSGRLPEALE